MIFLTHKLHIKYLLSTCICIAYNSFCIIGCKQAPVEYNDNSCKKNAPFINKLGFNASKSFFTTADKRIMGLVLVDASQGVEKKYQDSSWKKAGWLAPLQIDEEGNVFVGPAPFINVLHNATKEQNTLYKVDAQNGTMAPFVELPQDTSVQTPNPFGIIGLAYLCEAHTLYVSTIGGSDRQHERGCIYQIDVHTKKIMNQISNIDALGMGISYVGEQRKLYFGKARSSEVYGIQLDENGNFIGKPTREFSIAALGIRGDDKVRKIKAEKDGSLTVYGIEFNFNLVAPSEKLENLYKFIFDQEQKKWIHLPQ